MPADPAELFGSEVFSVLIQELSKHYDRILVDAPPVTSGPDAQILATCCKVTLLVVRADHSNRKLSEQAREALTNVGASILGVVVNGSGVQGGVAGTGWRDGFGPERDGGVGDGDDSAAGAVGNGKHVADESSGTMKGSNGH
jgi:Mrp family chromosome partitioning ATPase